MSEFKISAEKKAELLKKYGSQEEFDRRVGNAEARSERSTISQRSKIAAHKRFKRLF